MSSSSANYFIDQEKAYQGLKPDQASYTKKILAEIDLLKLVNDLGCPISGYDGIMKWAKKWKSNGLSFSVDVSKSTFKTRSAVLNRLSQRYDLDQTKPFQKEVQLVTNNTDNE